MTALHATEHQQALAGITHPRGRVAVAACAERLGGDVDVLITDQRLPANVRQQPIEQGIEVVLA